jgi:DNA-binding transcriptional MocR family regulator
MDGWVRWLSGLRGEYERRMNRMCRILDIGAYQVKTGTHTRVVGADWGVVIKTKLYEFDWPGGGMFVWVRMCFENHPLWHAVGTDGKLVDGTALSTALLIFLTKKPFLVLVGPGIMFSSTDKIRTELGWAFYRLCFAAEAEENVDTCSQRFVNGVHQFWRIKNVDKLEELLKDVTGALDASESGEAERLGNLSGWMGC